MTIPILGILFFLILKHFIVDFLMQEPYEYLNKGKYGHLGGIMHAGSHGFVTWFVLGTFCGVSGYIAFVYAIIETIIHYHIDWGKMWVNARYNLTPTNSERYWHLLGFDQWLHYMTYWCMLLSIDQNWL